MAVNQEAAAMSTGIQALSLANHFEDEKEDKEEEVCDAAAMSTGIQALSQGYTGTGIIIYRNR
jgi:hypothetical protein